jgi:ArsR family transcriptional regulator, virulence genes transcriptional regulator
MEPEQERHLYQLQAELCHVLAEPTRLEILHLLGERPRVVKELIEATGQRQAKISQHLSILRQRGIVRTERVGTEIRYSLETPRILDACRITREILLQRFDQQRRLAVQFVSDESVSLVELD